MVFFYLISLICGVILHHVIRRYLFKWRSESSPPTFSVRPEDIRLGKLLGSGSSGNVFNGLWRGSRVAVKEIHTSLAPKSHEIWLGEHLRHPIVVPVYGSCIRYTTHSMLMVMEVCDKGSLLQAGELTWSGLHSNFSSTFSMVLRNLIDVACAVEYLHANMVCHGDLKCGNILCRSSRLDPRGYICKVGDFGLAVHRGKGFQVESHSHQMGTTLFTSPEQLRGQRVEKSCDVYAFGVLAWHMMCGDSEDASLPDCVQHYRVVEEDWRPEIANFVPAEYRDMIVRCWDADIRKRPTINEVLDFLLEYLQKVTQRGV